MGTAAAHLVDAARKYAVDHYEGCDVIVEAFTDPELAELLTEHGVTDEASAIQAVREYCGLRREVENDVRGYGDLPPLANILDDESYRAAGFDHTRAH